MKVAIIGCKTGNGHTSVMNSLKNRMLTEEYEIDTYPDFYEKMMLSNKILSEFYNYLMMNSISLCNRFCEFSYITHSAESEDFYQGVKKYVYTFLQNSNYDIIISVAHSINFSIIRALKELGLYGRIKFVIVVTDPFEPMAVGFNAKGADLYFCSSVEVKDNLKRANISDEKVIVTNYPIDEKFNLHKINYKQIYKKLNFDEKKDTILINSSAVGIYYYLKLLKIICNSFPQIQVIFISGRNKALFEQSKKYCEKYNLSDRIKIYDFVENMQDYLAISSLVITKAGANSVFESLVMETPILLDTTEGVLFHEAGTKRFLETSGTGVILESIDDLVTTIEFMLNYYNRAKMTQNIKDLKICNGNKQIVDHIKNIMR